MSSKPVFVGLTTGLALLFLAALLWGLQGITPARADHGTLYVDGASGSDDSDCRDPADPCATIGCALAQAGNGDEILVAAGTYIETLDIHGNPITLRGGYTISGTAWLPQGETVIDANGADSAVFTIGPGFNVTVEGFTVQGANHTSDWGGGFDINGATVVISDTVLRDNFANGGGGVFVANEVGAANARVSLINSALVGNAADGLGTGLAVLGPNAVQVTISNTVFTGNSGGIVLNLEQAFEIIGGQVSSNTGGSAIRVDTSGSGTISGTRIASNMSGAIANSGALTVTNSTIEDHRDAEWAVWSDNHLVMDGCTIQGNATYGIVDIYAGHTEIRDSMVIDNDNAAVNGDVIGIGDEPGMTPAVEMANVLVAGNNSARPTLNGSSPDGSITLMNVTVADNSVLDLPTLAGEGNWTIINTIVWGNTTPGDMLGFGTFSVSYSDIEGGWTGTGNIDADPQFVDPASGDYHLEMGSPCIDKGTPAGAPADDIEGTPRDMAPDMGAYEWTGPRIFLPLTVSNAGP